MLLECLARRLGAALGIDLPEDVGERRAIALEEVPTDQYDCRGQPGAGPADAGVEAARA